LIKDAFSGKVINFQTSNLASKLQYKVALQFFRIFFLHIRARHHSKPSLESCNEILHIVKFYLAGYLENIRRARSQQLSDEVEAHFAYKFYRHHAWYVLELVWEIVRPMVTVSAI
jgi:hypothetical protein